MCLSNDCVWTQSVAAARNEYFTVAHHFSRAPCAGSAAVATESRLNQKKTQHVWPALSSARGPQREGASEKSSNCDFRGIKRSRDSAAGVVRKQGRDPAPRMRRLQTQHSQDLCLSVQAIVFHKAGKWWTILEDEEAADT